MVEFAIVLPVLLLIVLGIIQFGFIFNSYVTITNATREAARQRTTRIEQLARSIAALEPRHAIAQGWRRVEEAQRRLLTFVIVGGLEDKYEHSAYEVVDLDAVGQGQQVLRAKGHKHLWGIGRHVLGSQIFDYWFDPDGLQFDAPIAPFTLAMPGTLH
mgnify:CR=1 FL=1